MEGTSQRASGLGSVAFAVALTAAAVLVGSAASGDQGLRTPTAQVTNLRSAPAGRTVTVTYDLIADDPRAVFTVTLEASDDGGRSWTVLPKTVTGDVGSSVAPGAGKTIVWNAGNDLETPRLDRFQFRVTPVAVRALAPPGPRIGRLSVSSAPSGAAVVIDGKPRGTTPVTLADVPAGAHEVILRLSGYLENRSNVQVRADAEDNVAIVLTMLPLTPGQPTPKAGGGSRMKWALLAGGGGAAAAAGAVLGKGSGSPSSSTSSGNTPPSTTPPPAAATFSLTGRLTDSVRLTALPSVGVTVVGGPNDGKSATSNTDGDYSISALAAGTFSVRFRDPAGWYEERTQTVTIATADQKLDVAMNANVPVPKFTNSPNPCIAMFGGPPSPFGPTLQCLVDASTTQFGTEFRWTYEGGSGGGVTHSLSPVLTCQNRPTNTTYQFPVTLQVCNPSGHCRTVTQNVPVLKQNGCF